MNLTWSEKSENENGVRTATSTAADDPEIARVLAAALLHSPTYEDIVYNQAGLMTLMHAPLPRMFIL